MLSGISIATTHLVGVVAIIRQAHPDWTPAMIGSTFITTTVHLDSLNNPLVAYDEHLDQYGQPLKQFTLPRNAFDFGGGFVDAVTSLNPGLVFDASYTNFINFLCSVIGLTATTVKAATLQTCPPSPGLSSNLNLPNTTIGDLIQSRGMPQTITNVRPLETYTVVFNTPNVGINITVVPSSFTIAPTAMSRRL